MIVKSTRLKCPFGSLGWIIFFGIPNIIIVLSTIFAVEQFVHFKDLKSILPPENYSIAFLIIGVSLYFLQLNKLRFKTSKLTKSIEEFKECAIKILNEEGWEIEHNNNTYIQAMHRKRITSFPLITIRFNKSEIRWNIVYHPESNKIGSFGALLSPNIFGRKTLKKIIASA